MKKLRVSSTFNIYGGPSENVNEYVREGLKFYKEVGFDSADFGVPMLTLSSDKWKAEAEQMIKDSDDIGIHFEMGHLPFVTGGAAKSDEYMAEFDKKMRNAIDAAALLGLEYAVMHPNTTTLPMKKYNAKEQFESVISHLGPYVDHANKVGLNVVVENMRIAPSITYSHRYGQTPEELCEIADALGIGVCWDFGHANISGIRQSEGLAYVGKRLKVIHINDNDAIEDRHILPFTGSVDWRDAMHGLALAEYDGLLNFELAAGRVPASMRKAYAAYVLESAKELMSYIE